MLYAKLGGLLAIIGLCSAGYLYVKDLQDKVVDASKANARYEIAMKEMRFSMEGIMDDIQNNKRRSEELDKKLKKNSTEMSNFAERLSRHDVHNIIQKKPMLFKKIAQKGTNEYYKELKEISRWEEK